MPRYEKGTADMLETISRMMEKYHQPLKDAEIKIDVLSAFASLDKNGDEAGPPVKLHGRTCLAVVRIVPYKQRVKGAGDAEIVIDAKRCEELSGPQRDSLIDHELEHLEIRRSGGAIVRDDLGRPKLRMIQHDVQLGMFHSNIRRHGKHSIDWQQFQALIEGVDCPLKQLWLPYVEAKAEARVGTRKGKEAAVND